MNAVYSSTSSTYIKLFCIKMIQRASTRLERYRYLVQKLQISWNIQISIKFSFPSSASISYHRRKALSGISAWFFAPLLLFPLWILPFTFSRFFSISVSILLWGLVSILLFHYQKTMLCISLWEGRINCDFDTNLYITLGSKYTPGHPAGLGLNCKVTVQCAHKDPP